MRHAQTESNHFVCVCARFHFLPRPTASVGPERPIVVPPAGSSVAGVTVLRVALAQLNPTVGDLDGNLAKILHAYDLAEAAGCDIVAFPELSITGYPPEDLVLKPGFVADNEAALGQARRPHRPLRRGRRLRRRGLATCSTPPPCAPTGEVLGTYRKRLLPNYAVFDEARYFTPGNETDPLELYVIGGVKVGISICEDIWSPDGPLAVQADGGAELAVNINALAVPPRQGRLPRADARHPRRRLPTRRWSTSTRSAARTSWSSTAARSRSTPRATCSPAARSSSRTCSIVDVPDRRRLPPAAARPARPECRRCRCRTIVVSTDAGRARASRIANPVVDPLAPEATSCTRRSCSAPATTARKNGFTDVVIGLSGGIDSTLVAVIAADALGADHVHGVSMPSRYSSDHSKTDAALLAANLGLDYRTIPIEPAFTAYLEMLGRRASRAARPG